MRVTQGQLADQCENIGSSIFFVETPGFLQRSVCAYGGRDFKMIHFM